MPSSRLLFACAVFLSSFLLFLVEPLAAKQLLPVLGGSAAVWITCLVFFQTALLVGYSYAHWLARSPRWPLHFLLLAVAAGSAVLWSLRALTAASGAAHPILTVFKALGLSIGLPFIILSATSPLLQVWWARFEKSSIPYRLFALSNVASLLALASYPTLVEPNLTLHTQRLAWCAGFVVFVALAVVLAIRARTVAADPVRVQAEEETSPATPPARKLLWILLPMAASMQLSAVTSFLTANVAAIPLLWILPLSVYLLTIIFAFQFARPVPHVMMGRLLIVTLASLGYSLSHIDVSWPMWLSITIFLIEVFLAGLFCHFEVVARRPSRVSESTQFFLLFAAGGALGSFLIGIAFPLLFSFNYDLPITVFITALLGLAVTWRYGWNQRLLWAVASVMLFALLFMMRFAYQRNTTVAVRNFYAALRVKQDHSYPGATVRTLLNGTIQHGTQIYGTEDLRHTPTTYYAPDSGVGLALRYCCTRQDGSLRPRHIGVIGLGTGTVAAYGQPGDHIRFYEINPAVPAIARNVFTYIRDSAAQIDVVPGDARTSLSSEPPQGFDVLVIDAFSGDAIPLHLLTVEALSLYRRHLAPGGILAFHISNQHVDLGPPIAQIALTSGMHAQRISSVGNATPGEFSSTWMLVSDNIALLNGPEIGSHAATPTLKPGLRTWSDDYSALLPVLRW